MLHWSKPWMMGVIKNEAQIQMKYYFMGWAHEGIILRRYSCEEIWRKWIEKGKGVGLTVTLEDKRALFSGGKNDAT